MSNINYILGGDSITVFVDGNSYTINRQAPTFELVLDAVRKENLNALRDAVNVRKAVTAKLSASTAGSKVRIEQDAIFYGDYEVTGLISSRIFEMLRLGVSVKPMVAFLDNLMQNPSKRAVDELFGFIDACRLPITADGHFLAYKRVRGDYRDVHSGRMDNSVGSVLEMPRNMVDEDKNRTCSAGLHFCSYEYLAHFGGERIMVLKINPRDVVAIPADYNNSKGRTCRYEVVDELPVNEYRMPERTITNDFTTEYSAWDEAELPEDSEWDESSEESWEESDDTGVAYEDLYSEELEAIIESVEDGEDDSQILMDWDITQETLDFIKARHCEVKAAPAATSSAKLQAADVKQIRRLLNKGDSLASIARQFGVHPRSIARIRDGEAWTDV